MNTPEDAFNCFMGTELDKLESGTSIWTKMSKTKLIKDYKTKFELDYFNIK